MLRGSLQNGLELVRQRVGFTKSSAKIESIVGQGMLPRGAEKAHSHTAKSRKSCTCPGIQCIRQRAGGSTCACVSRSCLHWAPHHDAVLGGQAQRHHLLQLPAAGLEQRAPLPRAALLAAAHDQHLRGVGRAGSSWFGGILWQRGKPAAQRWVALLHMRSTGKHFTAACLARHGMACPPSHLTCCS